MKLFSAIPLCIAGALAGSGIGWLLRGTSRPADAAISVSAGPASGPSGPSAAVPPPPHGKPLTNSPPGPTAFSAVRETGGPLRWLVLLGEADEADAARMPALIKAAAGEWEIVSLLAQRWAELDPQHMFKTLRADALTNQPSLDRESGLIFTLFGQWAKADPEAAIAALKEPAGLPADGDIRRYVASLIMQSDPARAMKLMIDWKIRNTPLAVSALGKWVDENPRGAAEVATAGDLGSASREIMKRIGTAWAASDPAAALAFAAEKHGTARLQLADAVITEWARRDLKAAVAHLAAEPDAAIRGKLGLPIVESWAAQDPQAALLWANENLKGAARNSAAASIVKAMAAKDTGAAAGFIAGLDEGSAKEQSVNQLLRTWLGRNRPEDATAAFQWIAAMPKGTTRQRALEDWGDQFIDYAPDVVTAFLESPAGAGAPSDMFNLAARYLAQKNPETAMQWAEKAPAARRNAARDGALKEWLANRPDAATEWVRALPPGEARTRNVAATALILSGMDAAGAGTWLRTLTDADHRAARQGLAANLSLSDKSRAELEALIK